MYTIYKNASEPRIYSTSLTKFLSPASSHITGRDDRIPAVTSSSFSVAESSEARCFRKSLTNPSRQILPAVHLQSRKLSEIAPTVIANLMIFAEDLKTLNKFSLLFKHAITNLTRMA